MKIKLIINNSLYIKITKLLVFFILLTSAAYSQYNSERGINDIGLNNKIKLKDNGLRKSPADDDKKSLFNVNPQLIFSFIGGFNMPTADLKGDISTVNINNSATSAPSYFEKWGYNYGMQGKLSIDKKNRFRLTISMVIHKFLNSGRDSSGLFTIEPELGFVQIGLGAEWSFMSFQKFVPFIGAEAHFNSYYGSITFIEDSSQSQFSLLYNPVRRYGISAGAGVDYYASKSIGITAGIKYTIANLIGKNFDASGLHDLDDESYVVKGVTIPQKTISYINFYAGFSVFLGD